jgi:hypothetical protein
MSCQDVTMLQFLPKRHTISMEESIASPSHLDMALNYILAVISLDYATIYSSSPYDFNGALNCNTVGIFTATMLTQTWSNNNQQA